MTCFHHLGTSVRDIEVSYRFYRDTAGLVRLPVI